MSPKGVLIRCDSTTGMGTMKSSGVLFDGCVALTCGTLFLPLSCSPRGRKLLQSILRDANSDLGYAGDLNREFAFAIRASPESDSVDARPGCEAVVWAAWKCPLVLKSIEEILDDWTFGENAGGNKCLVTDKDAVRALSSLFLILKMRTSTNVPVHILSFIENVVRMLEKPVRGQGVVVESTPFGSDVLLNSLSSGIISNVIGRQNCLFLTDARIVPGCEGGPVYSAHCCGFEKNSERHLLGLINSTMTWWRGEYVGLALGVSLLSILRRFVLPLRKFNNSAHLTNHLKDRNLTDEIIILIRCGEFWGTGLVVDAASGCIITCSHVLKDCSTNNINAFHNGNKYSADLIFRTQDDFAYDIAVVKISTPNAFKMEIKMDETPAQVGETVIAAGFPLFNENKGIGLRSTIVRGCIAKTSPVMFQTTCCIQYGASGGAIIRNGKMLGLVVSNLRNSSTKALYPHINFAIPASVFSPHITNYINTGNLLSLKNLESSDPAVQRLWRLEISKL